MGSVLGCLECHKISTKHQAYLYSVDWRCPDVRSYNQHANEHENAYQTHYLETMRKGSFLSKIDHVIRYH